MENDSIVDMGQYIISEGKELSCIGLGSCIGVAIYSPERKIGGLAHVMLPKKEDSVAYPESFNMNKFANVVIPKMINDLLSKGVHKQDLVAKIAGGASIFKDLIKSDLLNIGKQNEQSVKEELGKLPIKILAEDLGGEVGRTINFNVCTGVLTIRTKEGTKSI